jgi:hypothetical protein
MSEISELYRVTKKINDCVDDENLTLIFEAMILCIIGISLECKVDKEILIESISIAWDNITKLISEDTVK